LLHHLALAGGDNQEDVSPATLYRFLRARGLTERQLLLDKTIRPTTRRAFRAAPVARRKES